MIPTTRIALNIPGSHIRSPMVVEVDDVEDEDLLMHFDACNNFIQQGLDSDGGVLVHWLVSLSSSICYPDTLVVNSTFS